MKLNLEQVAKMTTVVPISDWLVGAISNRPVADMSSCPIFTGDGDIAATGFGRLEIAPTRHVSRDPLDPHKNSFEKASKTRLTARLNKNSHLPPSPPETPAI